MLAFARQSDAPRFRVATDTGILHGLRKAAPLKIFEPVRDDAVCRYMKMITLEKVRDSLRDWKHEVQVDADVASRARLAIERMVEIAWSPRTATEAAATRRGRTFAQQQSPPWRRRPDPARPLPSPGDSSVFFSVRRIRS
jgi:hypothetical protein